MVIALWSARQGICTNFATNANACVCSWGGGRGGRLLARVLKEDVQFYNDTSTVKSWGGGEVREKVPVENV